MSPSQRDASFCVEVFLLSHHHHPQSVDTWFCDCSVELLHCHSDDGLQVLGLTQYEGRQHHDHHLLHHVDEK